MPAGPDLVTEPRTRGGIELTQPPLEIPVDRLAPAVPGGNGRFVVAPAGGIDVVGVPGADDAGDGRVALGRSPRRSGGREAQDKNQGASAEEADGDRAVTRFGRD